MSLQPLGAVSLFSASTAVALTVPHRASLIPSSYSVIFSTEPLWATFVSRLFLKETMGPNAAVGAACILLACLTAQSEQIMDLLGMRGPNKQVSPETHTGEGRDDEQPRLESDDRDAFPLSVLDEVEPESDLELDSSYTVSLLDEYAVPVTMRADGTALGASEPSLSGNEHDEPGRRLACFASMGPGEFS